MIQFLIIINNKNATSYNNLCDNNVSSFNDQLNLVSNSYNTKQLNKEKNNNKNKL